MLPEFKKRIDTLRDILVGAVPSPAGQIEQITYALIYKFMSDIDDKAASLPNGKRTYFTGEYEKYGWHNLLTQTLGAHERLVLYREALGKMVQNPGLPVLFQEIYQNAYLTFNDPRVLTLFLKEIDNFSHSNSDDIGDAYEYLLQITGAQGDVGQFRTPRHIIKFITEAVNPGKNDSVLDPAVGTAGFLISAYNHVKRHHDGVDEITGLVSETEQQLNSDEREKLFRNYHGFDIDPTMVRTAKVNMYLHGFSTPDIKNHDSLSSEDFWNEKYDVILANPPFMSPKGGIKPHDKFGIVANRAEVLFVDYIASHLKPSGRAGIVVPEGIIFQSGKAYKELRKNLVENSLYAVISLPAGVFQPYSGVKTSILLIDQTIAKQRDEILFIRIENDGYSNGSQRREIAGGQFKEALAAIQQFKLDGIIPPKIGHTASKAKILLNNDYNLDGERYKSSVNNDVSVFPKVRLGEVLQLNFGERITQKNNEGTVYPVYGGGGESFKTDKFNRKNEFIIARFAMSKNCVRYVDEEFWLMDSGATFSIKEDFRTTVDKDYVGNILLNMQDKVFACARGGAQKNLKNDDFYDIQIPLPPIDIQRKIVLEINEYKIIIKSSQTIVESYRPNIDIDPSWELVTLESVCAIGDGNHSSNYPKSSEMLLSGVPFIRGTNLKNRRIDDTDMKFISTDKHAALKKGHLLENDILFTNRGEIGKVAYVGQKHNNANLNSQVAWLRPSNKIEAMYLLNILSSPSIQNVLSSTKNGATLQQFTIRQIKGLTIPLPKIEIQKRIISEIKFEERLIDANRKLLEIYKMKLEKKINSIWGK